MAETRREKVDRILKVIPPYGSQLSSDLDAQKFQQVTNWTHQGLVAQWAKEEAQYQKDLVKQIEKGIKAIKHTTTTCNAFTGWYGGQLGSQKHVGRFDIEQVLPEAWVASDLKGGNRPDYGDICRFRPPRFHVGVSLDFDGDTWNSVEAGQGGPSSGRDIVTRKRTAYTPALLQGWIDISKLAGVELAPVQQPVPGANWLMGWWVVIWRGWDFFYLFERNGRVGFTRTRPRANTDPLPQPIDTGNYTIANNITITWDSTGSVEVLQKSPSDTEMTGIWEGRESLKATKL